jgi:hypothetical protein
MNTVVPRTPAELPRSEADGGMVAAGWLSVFLIGPLALLLMSATSGRESAFRRFQLAQAAIAQVLLFALCLLGFLGSGVFGIVVGGGLGGLLGLLALFVGLGGLLGGMGLAVHGAVRLGQGRDLVLPVLGPALFRRSFAGVPAEVPVERPDPSPVPSGPFASPRGLPRRPGDVPLVVFGWLSSPAFPVILPFLILLLQPRASPYLRFQLKQAAFWQLGTTAGLLAAMLLMQLAVAAAPLFSEPHLLLYGTVLFGVFLAGLSTLLLYGLPIVATLAVAFGADFVLPVLGPRIFRQTFERAGAPARLGDAHLADTEPDVHPREAVRVPRDSEEG